MEKNKLFCNNCPRHCNKNIGTFCGVSNDIKISKIMLHNWEEPCISFKNGSGTIFFSGCNLKCVYCQNHQISNACEWTSYTANDLVNVFKKLENMKADNINLVTPTPYANQILQALNIYKPKIPVIYNCSGYEELETF